MQTFQHKNVQITLDHNGRFIANVNGKVVRKQSLAAMQKFIDTPPEFTPFKALRSQYGEATEIEVISIVKDRSKYARGRLSFRCRVSGYEFDERAVMENCQANIDTLALVKAKQEEIREITERMSAELEALREKLVMIKPDSYIPPARE